MLFAVEVLPMVLPDAVYGAVAVVLLSILIP
jgi:hypothetical protein